MSSHPESKAMHQPLLKERISHLSLIYASGISLNKLLEVVKTFFCFSLPSPRSGNLPITTTEALNVESQDAWCPRHGWARLAWYFTWLDGTLNGSWMP